MMNRNISLQNCDVNATLLLTEMHNRPLCLHCDQQKRNHFHFSFQCDHLFNVHVIQQDINENSLVNFSRVTNELSVYTCTVCDKVFKMLSHVRNHVLGHTDLKPFACRLCEYASNNKGLYVFYFEILVDREIHAKLTT